MYYSITIHASSVSIFHNNMPMHGGDLSTNVSVNILTGFVLNLPLTRILIFVIPGSPAPPL